MICECEVPSRLLRRHVEQAHSMSAQAYFNLRSPKGTAPRCACGCGELVAWNPKKRAWNTVIHGHFTEEQIQYRSERFIEAHQARTVEEEQARRQAISKSAKEHWKNLEPSEKERRLLNHVNSGYQVWYHTTPQGKRVLVQSSWEGRTADLLEALKVPFRRAKIVHLEGCLWTPDFLVNQTLYLEVKGHPLAVDRFNHVTLSGITGSLDKAVAILDRSPKPNGVSTFSELLRTLKWVYVPTCLHSLYEPYTQLQWKAA
jgi:hypothetical protein